jgi:hypothetical protein
MCYKYQAKVVVLASAVISFFIQGCASRPDAVLNTNATSVVVHTDEDDIPDDVSFVGSAIDSQFAFSSLNEKRIELKKFSSKTQSAAAANFAASHGASHALLIPMYPGDLVVELYAPRPLETSDFLDGTHVVVSSRATEGMELIEEVKKTVRGQMDYGAIHDALINEASAVNPDVIRMHSGFIVFVGERLRAEAYQLAE